MHGFLAMLIGHNRPIHELLNPKMKNQEEVFKKEFSGMTDTDFSYADHVRIFRDLVEYIQNGIKPYKNFLLAFVSLDPDFSIPDVPNLNRLPAIQWNFQNLDKLKRINPDKFKEQYDALVHLFK